MNKFFLVSLALASSMSFAAEVDYSRCTMYGGVQLDHDGKVHANQFQTIKSQRIDGNKEHLVFESSYGSKKFQQEVTLERDAQGRVLKVVSGGERPSAQVLQQYKDMMVNSAVAMAPMATGSFSGGYGQQGFMTQEPSYWLKKKKAAAPQEGSSTQFGYGIGFGGSDPNYEMVPLSKLTSDQAKAVGIDNVDELKRLRQQWKRDKKTANKLRDGYSKVVERSALVVPMGMETEFDIQDGVCTPKSMSSRFYNSQSGQVNTFPISSKEKCDKIRTVYQRHERKINECNQAGMKVSTDFFKEMYGEGGMVAGSAGGYVAGVAGGMSGGIGYMGAGMAGGMMGGYGGGYGGMGMGMYSPYGMGMGSDMNSISMQNSMCEWTYNRPEQQPRLQRNEGQQSNGSETTEQ